MLVADGGVPVIVNVPVIVGVPDAVCDSVIVGVADGVKVGVITGVGGDTTISSTYHPRYLLRIASTVLNVNLSNTFWPAYPERSMLTVYHTFSFPNRFLKRAHVAPPFVDI